MNIEKLIENLNNANVDIRLESLTKLKILIDEETIAKPTQGNDVNNHIHTSYSFSPYSPTKAIWMAYNAGLVTAGIMDHDSIAGAKEFIKAGKIMGIAATIGIECRVDMNNTTLSGKRINNTDQDSVAYMTIHGVPHQNIDTIQNFFEPYRTSRNIRNKKMVDNINSILDGTDIILNFEQDIIPISMHHDGGMITERHLSYALAHKLINKFGKGYSLVDYLKNTLNMNLSNKIENFLLDENNKNYAYDLLGAIKSDMIQKFYVPATDECADVEDVLSLAKQTGAISAYAYLGDVGVSTTGDKKTQKFEDDYIDDLFAELKNLGFNAVTYMPSRNTMQQLKKVKALCETYKLFQISGEDINQPRQSFICMIQRDPFFNNLYDATWALIGHEKQATINSKLSLFSDETIKKYPNLDDRIVHYKQIGLSNE